jgi:anti-sigma factor RsiW
VSITVSLNESRPRRVPTCDWSGERLGALVDGTLPVAEHRVAVAHIASCHLCRWVVARTTDLESRSTIAAGNVRRGREA